MSGTKRPLSETIEKDESDLKEIYNISGQVRLSVKQMGNEAFVDCNDDEYEQQNQRILSYESTEIIKPGFRNLQSLEDAKIGAENVFWREIEKVFEKHVDNFDDDVFNEFDLKDCDVSEDKVTGRDRDYYEEDFKRDSIFCLPQVLKQIEARGFESFKSKQDNEYVFSRVILYADLEGIEEHNYFDVNIVVKISSRFVPVHSTKAPVKVK
jgi:hypothetical protein